MRTGPLGGTIGLKIGSAGRARRRLSEVVSEQPYQQADHQDLYQYTNRHKQWIGGLPVAVVVTLGSASARQEQQAEYRAGGTDSAQEGIMT